MIPRPGRSDGSPCCMITSELSRGQRMRNLVRFLVLACFAGCMLAQSKDHLDHIGSSAVWQLPPGFIASGQTACDKSGNAPECMIQQMAKAGAPDDAVTFTRE